MTEHMTAEEYRKQVIEPAGEAENVGGLLRKIKNTSL